jgi:hypothetical protein
MGIILDIKLSLFDVILICSILYYLIPFIFLLEIADYKKITIKKMFYILFKNE